MAEGKMSIYRRPGSDNWWISVSIAGRKTRRTTGTADRAKAEEFEQRERERLWRLHRLGDRGAIRFIDVAERWLNETQKRTRDKDEMILAWLSGEIGDEALSSIDRDAIEELRRTALAEGMAPATVDRYMALLRALLRKCEYEWRLLDHAPKVPMYRPKPPEPRWLKPPEFERLLKELPLHLKLAARFAVLTGLRMREMLSLTWDRIDLAQRRAWIPGTRMKAGRPHGIPLNTDAVKVLRELRTLNPEGRHVFQWRGKPVDDCNGHAFKDAATRAGMPDLRWHDLRHTFASWAVQRGVTLHELMQLGGWSSYQMVLRYAHLAPDNLAHAAEKLCTNRAQRRAVRQLSH